jgi:hypothetical protein
MRFFEATLPADQDHAELSRALRRWRACRADVARFLVDPSQRTPKERARRTHEERASNENRAEDPGAIAQASGRNGEAANI